MTTTVTRHIGARDVVCIDEFLTAEECRAILRELRFTFWHPSSVVEQSADGSLGERRSAARRSETTTEDWFSPDLLRAVETIEDRIAQMFGIAADHLERWQATRYRRSEGYHYHNDAGFHGPEEGGDREHTVLVYVEAPQAGGETHFRDLDLEFAPEAGRMLVWRNLKANGATDFFMSHAALPVSAGQKTILVTWARERALRQPKQRQNRSGNDRR
jgi:prolyl 4-hydroxylase